MQKQPDLAIAPDLPEDATTKERFDSWVSLFSEMQQSVRDRASGLRWQPRTRMSDAMLEGLYEQNAIAARVVDKIVDDSLREGWDLTIPNDEGEARSKAIKSWLEDLCFDQTLGQSEKWGRLYGGALLCSATTDYDPDTGEVRKPHEQIGKVAHVYRPFVVPRADAIPLEWDVVYGSPTYHKVLKYQIVNESGKQIILHHSRCHVIEPIPMPPTMARRREWGPSVLERPFDGIARYGAALQHGTSMMYVASLLWLMLEGYRKDYMSKDGPARLRERLAELFKTIDSRGALVLDRGDQVGSTSLSMTGATDMVDRNRDAMAADMPGMPKEIALNESPAGLNAGQLSGPQELWFGECKAFQQRELVPAINWFLGIAMQTQKDINEWKVEFPPLWTRSDGEAAEISTKWATSDQAYVTMGADAAQIVKARLVDGVTGPLELKDEPTVQGTPLDLSGAEINAAEAATAGAASPETPADTAMNGAQISSLLEILKAVNTGELTYEQGLGALSTAFPNLRGREVAILGPKPAVAPVNPNAPPPAPDPNAPVVETEDEIDPLNGPSDDPIPADSVSPQEAAAKFRVHTRTITRLMERKNEDGSPMIRYWGFGSNKRVSLADIVKAARAHEGTTDKMDADELGDLARIRAAR